jgi:hypothetical protein
MSTGVGEVQVLIGRAMGKAAQQPETGPTAAAVAEDEDEMQEEGQGHEFAPGAPLRARNLRLPRGQWLAVFRR